MTHSQTFMALVRGINVGGRNTVPMAELRSALAGIGLEDVATYIQSGNVVIRHAPGEAAGLASAMERCIEEGFGVSARVVVRTRDELAEVAGRNPFLERGADPAQLHVVFLDREPEPGAVAELDPVRSPPDEFEVHGREIYLRLPNGMGRTKLSGDYFERRLGVAATARNWKTVLALVELADR
jgi:uncharacterized protein (DUF1697 family)